MVQPLDLSIILGLGRSILSSFRMTTTSGVVSTVTGPGIMISRLWTKFFHGMLRRYPYSVPFHFIGRCFSQEKGRPQNLANRQNEILN